MSEKVKKFRYLIFLKDTILLSITAFGGPHAHISHMFKLLVEKRRYVSEEELIELNALCQILPGPTSTQTVIAIGYKTGGTKLALLTLLVWILPAGAAMVFFAVFITQFNAHSGTDLTFTKYIQPMALSFILYSGIKLARKVLHTKTAIILFVNSIVLSTTITYWLGDKQIGAVLFPVLLIFGGVFTALTKRFKQKKEWRKKRIQIDWTYFVWFASIFVLAVVVGNLSGNKFLLQFENFYRNGSLIFGGGQVLIPLLKTEFVELKDFLTGEEFLSGFGFVQGMPGPVFSFCGYLGAISEPFRLSVLEQIIAGGISLLGIFLPGTLLIFFVIKFWEELKKYRVVKASIEGISAVASGMVMAAVITLLFELDTATGVFKTTIEVGITNTQGLVNLLIMGATFLLLFWDKIPAPFLIIVGLLAGIWF